MKEETDLRSLSDAAIVARFEHLCIQQYDAMERDDDNSANRLIWKLYDLENELKSRLGDQRHLLKTLFGHPNKQIRLSAAQANLAIDYIAARQELQAIADSKWYPRAAEASFTLRNIDAGLYRPT